MREDIQQTADIFWQTHFADWLDKPLTEYDANAINFWENLQSALADSDIETIKAVILSNPALNITTGDMYKRIVRTAKYVWDDKRD